MDEKKLKIVIWMNQPSHYQTVFFRELVEQGTELQVFYHTGVADFRKQLGWAEAGNEAYGQHYLKNVLDGLCRAWRHRRAIHLVNGLWTIPPFIAASVLLLVLGARVHFHAEHPDPAHTRGGWWMLPKQIWVRLLYLRAAGLWAIGGRAADFYARLGVPRHKIHPFLYFTDLGSGAYPTMLTGPSRDIFRVIYVGQFVEWKRADDLITAIRDLRREGMPLELVLVGAGKMRDSYQHQISEAKLSACARIKGPLAPQEVLSEIQRSSVLVLPSQFDGWGLTVNEALLCGIPAVCSDGCGAAELLVANPSWGLVFPVGNVAELAKALCEVATHSERFRPIKSEVESQIGAKTWTSRFLRAI